MVTTKAIEVTIHPHSIVMGRVTGPGNSLNNEGFKINDYKTILEFYDSRDHYVLELFEQKMVFEFWK